VNPERCISSKSMTSTGLGVSVSARRMREPVMTTSSSDSCGALLCA